MRGQAACFPRYLVTVNGGWCQEDMGSHPTFSAGSQVSFLVGKKLQPNTVCIWKFACLSAHDQLGTHSVVKVTPGQPVMKQACLELALLTIGERCECCQERWESRSQTLIGQHLSCKKGLGGRGAGLEVGLESWLTLLS